MRRPMGIQSKNVGQRRNLYIPGRAAGDGGADSNVGGFAPIVAFRAQRSGPKPLVTHSFSSRRPEDPDRRGRSLHLSCRARSR
jgi:hypothetical protein